MPRRESIPLVPVYSTQSIPASSVSASSMNAADVDPQSRAARVVGSDSTQPDVSAYGMFAVTGSSGFGDDDLDPPERSNRGPAANYYAEEQHWTDYLRIGLPVLGALILIVLVFFIASSVFGGDDDDDGQQGATGTATLPVITSSTPTVGTGGAVVTGTPGIIVTTPPAGAGQTPSTNPGGATLPTATPEAPPATGGVIYNGAIVVVANGGPEGVNMRITPAGDIVTTVLDGTQLTTTGEPQDAEGYTWWPVSGEAGDGFIAQDFLTLVE